MTRGELVRKLARDPNLAPLAREIARPSRLTVATLARAVAVGAPPELLEALGAIVARNVDRSWWEGGEFDPDTRPLPEPFHHDRRRRRRPEQPPGSTAPTPLRLVGGGRAP